MIDTQNPIQESIQSKERQILPTRRSKLPWIILLIVIIAGVVFTVWLFTKSSRAVTLSEGESYTFEPFTVKVDRVSNTRCQNLPQVPCTEDDEELGAQLSVRNPETGLNTFGYVGLESGTTLDADGMVVELQEVNFDDKEVKLKITKQ